MNRKKNKPLTRGKGLRKTKPKPLTRGKGLKIDANERFNKLTDEVAQ